MKDIEGLLVTGSGLKEKFGSIILAVLSGLLMTASFPKANLGGLAWVAFIPLFYAIKGVSPRKSFKLGFLTGIVHYATLLYWIVGVVNYYGHVPTLLSLIIFMLLVFYLGLYPGLFSAAVSQLRAISFPFYLTAPFFWVALEYVRSFFLSGFPWENLGYSQYDQLRLIQISDIFGVYGLSALIMAVNGVLFEFLNSVRRNRTTKWIALAAVGWASFARLIRGQVISLKQASFVEASKAIGCSNARILFVHIFPQCVPLAFVMTGLKLGGYILTEAGLSFLGLGAQPPAATLIP